MSCSWQLAVGSWQLAVGGWRLVSCSTWMRASRSNAMHRGVAASDPDGLVALVDEVELAADARGRLARVLVEGVDVTGLVHGPEIDAAVSAVSRVGDLRAALLQQQRAIAAGGRIIMAGRDIGTVVLPDADLKLFLDASVEERARRRIGERALDPNGPEAEDIRVQLHRRDAQDSTREVAPLRIAPDARVIVTDGNAIETTIDLVVAAITDRAKKNRAGAARASGAGRVPSEP